MAVLAEARRLGLNVSVVASRGTTTGNLTVALVGTTELPVDWAPRERPINHPRGLPVDPLVGAPGMPYPLESGSVSGGGPPGGGGGGVHPPPTPIHHGWSATVAGAITAGTPATPVPDTSAPVGARPFL
jgi:hypothetical protein